MNTNVDIATAFHNESCMPNSVKSSRAVTSTHRNNQVPIITDQSKFNCTRPGQARAAKPQQHPTKASNKTWYSCEKAMEGTKLGRAKQLSSNISPQQSTTGGSESVRDIRLYSLTPIQIFKTWQCVREFTRCKITWGQNAFSRRSCYTIRR